MKIVLSLILVSLIISFSQEIYLVGDSISMHYHPYLSRMIDPQFDYSRKTGPRGKDQNLDDPQGANGGDSGMVLDHLKYLLDSTGFSTDVIFINCGLHDIKRKSKEGKPQIGIEKYRDNLSLIFGKLKSRDILPVFITTTPVVDEVHASRMPYFYRSNADVKNYNKAATRVCKEYNVQIIDLYAFTERLGGQELYSDHVHFKDSVRRLQAAYLAGTIEKMLVK